METVLLITVIDSVLNDVHSFVGEHDEIQAQVEKHFISQCAYNIPNWDEYTQDDINATLEDGYIKWGNNSFNIHWV